MLRGTSSELAKEQAKVTKAAIRFFLKVEKAERERESERERENTGKKKNELKWKKERESVSFHIAVKQTHKL